jgi:pimeloyl-ACP methyl ester carboxylesterase
MIESSSEKLERRIVEIDTLPFPYMVGGDGPPVLLIHLPVNPMHVYTRTMPALAQHFRVYTVDVRAAAAFWYYEGYGSLLTYLTDYLEKVLNRLGLDVVDIIASFMGSGVTMSFAVVHPERVRRLVLISSLGLTTRPRTSIFALIFSLMNLPGMRFLFHIFMSSMQFQRKVLSFDQKVFGPSRVNEFFYELPKEGIEYHLSQLYDGLANPPNPFAFETFVNVIQHLRYGEIKYLIPTIEHETLLLFGEEDILIPPKIARKYKAAIPNSQLHFVPKARVFLHWEAADEVNRRIIEFLVKGES